MKRVTLTAALTASFLYYVTFVQFTLIDKLGHAGFLSVLPFGIASAAGCVLAGQ